MSIMNGSEVTPSTEELLQYCPTSRGLLAVMRTNSVLGTSRSWNPARSSVKLALKLPEPCTVTWVPFSEASTRKMSPPVRVASGAVRNCVPHVSVEGSCSTRWSQA